MSSKSRIHGWLCPGETSGRFLMLPPELFYNPQYQALTPAAGRFYIFLNVYRESEEQRACLFEALTEYNRIYDLGLSDFDIQNEARPTKGSKYNQGFFVAPMKHLEAAGFKKNYVTKLKKELIDTGFIKIAYGKKGRFNGWNQNTTVYQFIKDWQQAND